MTIRTALPAITSVITGYIVLIVVQLIGGKPFNANLFIVALGGAMAGGFGYWFGNQRKH